MLAPKASGGLFSFKSRVVGQACLICRDSSVGGVGKMGIGVQ